MYSLTNASRAALDDSGVRTVIDLRTIEETGLKRNVLAGSAQVTYLHQILIGDEPRTESRVTEVTCEAADTKLASYSGFLEARRDQIGLTPATLAEPGAPLHE